MLNSDHQINRQSTKKLKLKLKQISSLVKALEINYIDSQRNDRLLLMAVRLEATKNNSLQKQLSEALRENTEIMDMVQLRSEDGDVSRACSKINLGSSISTVSLVHLQYKYEELFASHRGLLKVLELRSNEVKKHLQENCSLKEKIEQLIADLQVAQEKVEFLQQKISYIKKRKCEKITRLRNERQTLALVHRRLVALLHRQCMEKNEFIESLLRTTTRSEKALLLQEIRKNNILNYENFQLQQELDYLKSLLKITRTTSKEVLQSDSGSLRSTQ
ncbi:uncharacterized protein LOC109543140 [Dendroctonus ponderosae]|uniref:uncharacterized protein LOC109543140 n=1 Tax=Dendroctonus ponderosae TaxID=77166 RepID=UPI002035069B|nr:uncharacterized protein LOC109543140 [Dendroctonus ponderosae]KAH1013060.1 hypothetical protein HUJ05_012111 [Dendroctonus ponderosae]